MVDIPWDSLHDLLRQEDIIKASRYYALHLIEEKCQRFPDIFNKAHHKTDCYPDFASLIVMAQGDEAMRFASCHNSHSRQGKNYRCCNRWLCPYCTYRNKRRYQQRFGGIILDGGIHYYHLTLSLHTSIPYEDAVAEPYLVVWNSAKCLLRIMRKSNYIHGHIAAEEMHVDSMHPQLLLLPHVHAIIAAEKELTGGDLQMLWENALSEANAGYDKQASSKLVPIITKNQMLATLGYLNKPIRFLHQYRVALACLDKAHICELNQNVVYFLSLLDLLRMENSPQEQDLDLTEYKPRAGFRHKVYTSGCFYKASASYVGEEEPVVSV
jgi:hypothetical protein